MSPKQLRTRPPLRKILKYEDASSKKQQFFEQCRKYALQSDMRSKHCAVLEYNGKIIAFSANHFGGNKNSFSLHAEQSVHKKYLKIQHKLKKRRRYNLWAFRFSEASGAMNSKPCYNCTSFIKDAMPYVSKVYYSWDDKHYICEDPKQLKTSHVSLGYQQHKKQQHKRHKCNC